MYVNLHACVVFNIINVMFKTTQGSMNLFLNEIVDNTRK